LLICFVVSSIKLAKLFFVAARLNPPPLRNEINWISQGWQVGGLKAKKKKKKKLEFSTSSNFDFVFQQKKNCSRKNLLVS
jgi:hypothetical protein